MKCVFAAEGSDNLISLEAIKADWTLFVYQYFRHQAILLSGEGRHARVLGGCGANHATLIIPGIELLELQGGALSQSWVQM